MKKLLALFLLLATPAFGQQVFPPADTINCAFNTVPPTVAAGSIVRVQCDSTGALLTVPSASGVTQVVGNVASGVADSGNPVKVGGKYNLALPTFADGNRGDAQLDANGSLRVKATGDGATGADGIVNTTLVSLGASASQTAAVRPLIIAPQLYNGATWDRTRSIGGNLGAGAGVAAVAIAPSANAGAGITSVVSGSAGNNIIIKAAPGNLYSVYATNLTATAGFLVVLNATVAPGDGAITPLECVPLPGNGNASINYNSGPAAIFSTGIVAVLTSATTCFTKTTGTITGFLKGSAQ